MEIIHPGIDVDGIPIKAVLRIGMSSHTLLFLGIILEKD